MKYTEKGNVLFIILAGIALFAILTATISSTMSGDVDMEEDRAKVRAAHVLEQETVLRGAYKMLRLANNCDVDEINFSLTADPAYNTNAPDNGRCSLYHSAGGGLRPVRPEDRTQDELDETYEETWVETSGLEVDGVGTTDSGDSACPGCDLAMLLFNVNEEICKQLNIGGLDMKTVYSLTGAETITPRPFDGTFSNDNLIDAADAPVLVGRRSFCIREAGGDRRNIYVSILEPR